MTSQLVSLLTEAQRGTDEQYRINDDFTPVYLQDDCPFPPDVFIEVISNILQNPNITSSHLFRADVLYDSKQQAQPDSSYPGLAVEDARGPDDVRPAPAVASFERHRTMIRRLVPRNPQLDKPLEQTCHFLHSKDASSNQKQLVICIPHVASIEEIPWYHPAIQGLAYLYSYQQTNTKDKEPDEAQNSTQDSKTLAKDAGTGTLVLYYNLFPSQSLPLPQRLQRTAHNLISTIYKHGRGTMGGYSKKFHHDLLLPQARVQDTYSALKTRHAKRLCDAWVEVTEPSKHVFEDLAIAAYLIELWRDLYTLPVGAASQLPSSPPLPQNQPSEALPLPPFPGFVDIGCGNGVLTDVLTCEGFPGWGFDARRRKTWDVVSPATKQRLRELILIPQPMLNEEPVLLPEAGYIPSQPPSSSTKRSMLDSAVSTLTSIFSSTSMSDGTTTSLQGNDQSRWHNGLFPRNTFIISNHADELTAWTPLLASLSDSPFFAIPCCSHNLSGARFRAPSAYTGFTADASAPQYFAREKMAGRKKFVAIQVPTAEEMNGEEGCGGRVAAETGDLKAMSRTNRGKQVSAYSSLCDWVAALADEVGYEVEKDLLRIPSTRNVGIIGRKWADGERVGDGEEGREVDRARWEMVKGIMEREKADGKAWIERARKLMAGNDTGQTVHG